MNAGEVLRGLHDLGVSIQVDGGNIIISPASIVPPELKAAIRQHKPAILARLRPVGNGQPPPLGPATRE